MPVGGGDPASVTPDFFGVDIFLPPVFKHFLAPQQDEAFGAIKAAGRDEPFFGISIIHLRAGFHCYYIIAGIVVNIILY